MPRLAWLRARARRLREDTGALYHAARDPDTPWYARAFIACVVAYALSPIDLIPDFIPVLGLLDDLVLVPLGLLLAIRMIPPEIMDRARQRARANAARPASRAAAAAIVVLWVLLAVLFALGVRAALATDRAGTGLPRALPASPVGNPGAAGVS